MQRAWTFASENRLWSPVSLECQGGGYSMDLNFACLVLPTLKSLQTTMRP